MLKKEGKINDAIIENMLSWHHTGFHVYIGNKIDPDDGIPAIILSAMSSKEFRKNWARLIALKLHFVPESV